MRARRQAAGATTRTSLMVLALVWAGLALVAAGYGWVWGAEARLIAAEGVQAEAVVAARRVSESRSGAQVDEDFHVTLRFADSAGQPQETEVEVTRDRYDALAEGTRVTLTYAASDPGVVELTPGDLAASVRRANVAALVLGAAAVVFAAGWALVRRR